MPALLSAPTLACSKGKSCERAWMCPELQQGTDGLLLWSQVPGLVQTPLEAVPGVVLGGVVV